MSKHVLVSNFEIRPGRKGTKRLRKKVLLCQNMSLFQILRYDQDEKGRKDVLISNFEIRPGRKGTKTCPYFKL